MSAPTRRSPRPLSADEAGAARWDLIVIGAGSAGLVAAKSAAVLGARVLLIEAGSFGGECLHTGCVPSKSLIAAAHAAHAARTAGRFGVHAGQVRVDFGHVMDHVRGAIAAIQPVDSPDALARAGVFTLAGRARFEDEKSLSVDGRRLRFGDAVIATGSAPVLPDVRGADAVEILTNETFWNLQELPERLLVLGGGAVGCELAQAMARLGSAVTLVHRGPRLLPREDPAASALVREALRADGVDVHLQASVQELHGAHGDGSSGGTAQLSTGAQVRFDRILAALGRRAVTAGLGLEAAGVAVDDSGAIAVDGALRTSNPRIRAAGDVTPLPRFTHTAGVFGSTAATNAVLGLSRAADLDVVPRVTFTAPEVGAVGVSPEEARTRGFRVLVHEHRDLDRAIAEGDTAGRTTIIVDRRGRIRGASIVGPRAGEALAEYTTAMRAGLTATRLATTTHAYPTYADAGWNAVVAEAQRGLRSGALRRGIRLLAGLHRRRRSRTS
ncbi:dihydrolipoyl dehydrogenase family protein [Microbacterium lacus]|uniref:FAD-dependent oxidoreductase n=1 Tax=Microbacterium lacus TaxID=415217 RepID=A0ABN2H8V7_9MICO